MEFNRQVEIVKMRFNDVDTPEERRIVFMMFVQDMSFHRGAICQAMKELKINNDFDIKTEDV